MTRCFRCVRAYVSYTPFGCSLSPLSSLPPPPHILLKVLICTICQFDFNSNHIYCVLYCVGENHTHVHSCTHVHSRTHMHKHMNPPPPLTHTHTFSHQSLSLSSPCWPPTGGSELTSFTRRRQQYIRSGRGSQSGASIPICPRNGGIDRRDAYLEQQPGGLRGLRG